VNEANESIPVTRICKKDLYAILPVMAEKGVLMGVNWFYKLMKRNGMMVPKRKKCGVAPHQSDE